MVDSLATKIRALQVWISAHGIPLAADGVGGPVTRNATIEVFRNRSAPAISAGELKMYADRLGCSVRQLATVALTESGGAGWDDSGLLKCLYERHFLFRRIRFAVPFLSDPKPGGYTIDADGDGINDSWEKLADAAMRFGFGVAAECASFGKFQVMGAWWKDLGYNSVADMVWRLSQTEGAHYDLLCRYIEHNGLVGAIRSIDGNPANCRAFAIGYNGKGQQGYDARLADNFTKLRGMA